MSNLKVLFPALDSVGAASTNNSRIQALLDAGGQVSLQGSGTCYVTGGLVMGDNTELIVPPSLTIRLAPGSNKVMLTSSAIRSSLAGGGATVTVNWTSGIDCPVVWTAHGMSVGEYVYLNGANEGQFRGVFVVTNVADANNLTLRLWRTPTANATGTCKALRANKNITVSGGIWDHDDANNPSSLFPDCMAIVLGACGNLQVNNVTIKRSTKYCLWLAALNGFSVSNVYVPETVSDVVKIYGPAAYGDVENISGVASGDDLLTLQPKEAAAFSQYNPYTWGDILNVRIRNVRSPKNGNYKIFAIYTDSTFIADNIEVDGVHGQTSGVAVSLNQSLGSGQGVLGRISVNNITAKAVYPCQVANATIDALRLGINNTVVDTTGANTNGNHIRIDTTAVVKRLGVQMRITDATYGASGAPSPIYVGGAVWQMDLTDVQGIWGSSTRFLSLSSTGGARVDKINFEGSTSTATTPSRSHRATRQPIRPRSCSDRARKSRR
ncbi:hypothetical protein Ql52_gp049 [Caulobacter phage Quill_5.2]|uniref:Uncharacterized protein n=1 Tax=Caulobacter phage Quill_5.2 TaxID=3075108 RepID=A0AA96PZJ6_9CAUD|nr:hypothetical protein Ql52_gp049 [Caulobacter phage Quill_5.2]